MFVALTLGTSGCGGISASHTVSPLDFLMPGVRNDANPPTTNAPVAFTEKSVTLAVAK
jgi:hypothetical protein